MKLAGMDALFDILRKIDGRPYQKFREIQGTYSAEGYTIRIDSVQGSPSSEPTPIELSVSSKVSGFPDDTYSTRSRRIALADLISRRFWESGRTHLKAISFPRPGQEILERGSVTVKDTHLTVSFSMDLPSAGKNAAGRTAAGMFEKLETVIPESLSFSSYKRSKLYNHIETSENADHVRSVLKEKGLAAFIGNGSVLPRRTDGLAPLSGAREFICRAGDAMYMDVPNGEPWTGMGIKRGLTVIAGPTGSGRSTLLNAIISGAHNHIPGDGREKVVASGDAMFISKQDRPVSNVDISSFVAGGKNITSDGLTGPFAESVAMSEAIEAGCDLLLFDEDASSPAILSRDPGMRMMISDEPVVPVTDLMSGSMSSGISVIAVSSRDSTISAADGMVMISGDEHINAVIENGELRPKHEARFSGPSKRFPMIRDPCALVLCGDLSDLRLPMDVSYTDSVNAALKCLAGSMDGSSDVRSLSISSHGLGPKEVRVRPVDIAMALNRCAGMSAINRTQ